MLMNIRNKKKLQLDEINNDLFWRKLGPAECNAFCNDRITSFFSYIHIVQANIYLFALKVLLDFLTIK